MPKARYEILSGRKGTLIVRAAVIAKGCAQASYKVGARFAATAATEVGEALFCNLSKFDKFLHVGGFAVSAVLLPLDIYSLVTNSMEIAAARKGKNDKEPEAVKKLRQLADKLKRICTTRMRLFVESRIWS